MSQLKLLYSVKFVRSNWSKPRPIPNFKRELKWSSSSVGEEPAIPPYKEKVGEPLHVKHARLLYQSRKRGMLENDLILSSFAHKYLKSMTEEELIMYDRLINLPSNDWEIYYWATGVKQTPCEFDNEVMKKLKEFVRNEDRQKRIRQPDL